jgi:hypothetical protein
MPTRRQFLFKGGAAALATVATPLITKANVIQSTADDNNAGYQLLASNPVFQQLLQAANSPDGKQVAAFAAGFYTDPILVQHATQALSNPASTLSGFQKSIYATFLAVTSDLPFLQRLLSGVPLKDYDTKQVFSLFKTLSGSPAILSLQAAGAELKTIPALSSMLYQGIQQFSWNLNTPLLAPMDTGDPLLNSISTKFYSITEQQAYIRLTRNLFPIAQRSEFADFLKLLSPLLLSNFIPFPMSNALQLPLDAPDTPSYDTLQAIAIAGALTATTVAVTAGAAALVGASIPAAIAGVALTAADLFVYGVVPATVLVSAINNSPSAISAISSITSLVTSVYTGVSQIIGTACSQGGASLGGDTYSP